ncbi:hypothetical protein NC653_003068 [Populus alba x Populus x berolinensis]|uniref:Uncharacterized protein n=1 Tax=Populus alba x Populus x berolinensis TaxID=444605 RepID=A0AAD6RR93_9ROSI|nr:hypothetical protein NC653_003068 [Populus alba x Populus x berolinensis]
MVLSEETCIRRATKLVYWTTINYYALGCWTRCQLTVFTICTSKEIQDCLGNDLQQPNYKWSCTSKEKPVHGLIISKCSKDPLRSLRTPYDRSIEEDSVTWACPRTQRGVDHPGRGSQWSSTATVPLQG